MSDLLKYSDLTTKIKAMRGKMLSQENYQELLQKQSVKEIALYLKNFTYYSDDLSDLNESNIHRGHLEVMLYRSVIRDTLKIAKHLEGSEKKFYRYIYRKLEVEDIKRMLRTLERGKKLEEIDKNTLFINRYSRLDFNKSLQSKTVEELVESLKETNFYSVLKPLLNREGQLDLFSAEMALDLYYYNQTSKQVKKMPPGDDREMLDELFGIEADIKNILWIYRAKKYYGLSKEMLYRYMIPAHHRLQKAQIKEFVDADLDKFITLLKSSFYKEIIVFPSEQAELQYTRYMFKVQKLSMKMNPYSLASVIGYMYLKETEVLNITNIVEGIRYKISKEEIRKYLTGIL